MTHEADICCARPRDASTHGSSALIHACPDPRTSPSARRLGPRAVCAVHGCYSHISCTMHACDAVARYRGHGASDASPCGSFALTYAIIIAPPDMRATATGCLPPLHGTGQIHALHGHALERGHPRPPLQPRRVREHQRRRRARRGHRRRRFSPRRTFSSRARQIRFTQRSVGLLAADPLQT